MIGENPLTPVNLDIVDALAPTLTPSMTNPFRELCDRTQSHILKSNWQQKYYADTKRRPVFPAVLVNGPVAWSSKEKFRLHDD